MISFEGAWVDLRKRLKNGVEIRGWSHARGHAALRFLVIDIASGSITVLSSMMSSSRVIGKSDFSRVYAAWPKYRNDKMTRAEMAELSQKGELHLWHPVAGGLADLETRPHDFLF